jgi:hypothetical protein
LHSYEIKKTHIVGRREVEINRHMAKKEKSSQLHYDASSFFMSRQFELLLCSYLVLSSVLDQYFSYVRHGEISFLWFCNIAALLLALGIYLSNLKIMSVIMIFAIPAQGLWIIDFFLEFFGFGFGRTAHLFLFGSDIFLTSLNLHIGLIPISIFMIWRHGFHRHCFGIAFISGLLLLIFSFIFTHPLGNINCVFYSCDVLMDAIEPKSEYLIYFIQYVGAWFILLIIFYWINMLIWSKLGRIIS